MKRSFNPPQPSTSIATPFVNVQSKLHRTPHSNHASSWRHEKNKFQIRIKALSTFRHPFAVTRQLSFWQSLDIPSHSHGTMLLSTKSQAIFESYKDNQSATIRSKDVFTNHTCDAHHIWQIITIPTRYIGSNFEGNHCHCGLQHMTQTCDRTFFIRRAHIYIILGWLLAGLIQQQWKCHAQYQPPQPAISLPKRCGSTILLTPTRRR